MNRIYTGDCRDTMRALIAGGVKVQTVITSPPYWGLRNYGIPPLVWGGASDCAHEWGGEGRWRRTGGTNASGLGEYENRVTAEHVIEKVRRSSLLASTGAFCRRCGAWRGDLGLEPTPWMYVAHMVEVFDLVRELLADDGTLWLNLGDCYASDGGVLTPHKGLPKNRRVTQDTVSGAVRWRTGKGGNKGNGASAEIQCRPNVALLKDILGAESELEEPGARYRPYFDGVKQKDLMGIPWAVAFALRAAGWWLRSDIIWHKRNPMPGSYKDRPTTTHEYLLLLAKRDRYYYDWEAISEPCSANTHARLAQDVMAQLGSDRANDGVRRNGRRMKAMQGGARAPGVTPKSSALDRSSGVRANASFHQNHSGMVERRNKRSVWEIGSEPYKGAHTATFPQALVGPCVLAGSRPGDIVFDPFMGSGTVAQVAARLGRKYLGCELNAENETLQRERIARTGHGLELA